MIKEQAVAGIDVGSASLHIAVISQQTGNLLSAFSRMHFGKPWDLLSQIAGELSRDYDLTGFAFTGTGGELAAEANATLFEYDTITIPRGIAYLKPDTHYVFHVGARDPYFFEIDPAIGKISEGSGTKCGGGTGILLGKQFKRYFGHLIPARDDTREAMEEQMLKVFEKAEEVIDHSKEELEIGGRCGVIITSDMIHKQNAGFKTADILNAMVQRVAINYISDVLKAREYNNEPAVATGGVAANREFVRNLESLLTLDIEVPPFHQQVAAIGAAILGSEQPEALTTIQRSSIDSLAIRKKETIHTSPPLSLENVVMYDEPPLKTPAGGVDVIIGVDGGSTTSKLVVVDADSLEMYYKKYISTSGDPEQAGKELFRSVREALGEKIRTVRGIGFTGSSGALYEVLFSDVTKDNRSDVLMDEITCHKMGVQFHNPQVDTIFELGGQDAKFTRLRKDGTVANAKMNLACFAGTGQTIENMASNYGMDVKSSLQTQAFQAPQVPRVDGTCAVFSEAGVADLAALEFSQAELAAAILNAGIGGYVHKFVGNEDIGDNCSAQGGPFLGKAALATLAAETGKKIFAFPHREVMGAMGAALAVKDKLDRKPAGSVSTAFRGFEIVDTEFRRFKQKCSDINGVAKCKTRDCDIDVYEIGSQTIYSGGACPKGNTDDSGNPQKKDYTAHYQTLLEKRLADFSITESQNNGKETVGIPRSMFFLNENAVFLSSLFHFLGFDVRISPPSNDEIVHLSFQYSHSEDCFPVKLAHGHTAFLQDKVDKLLLVNYIGAQHHNTEDRHNGKLKCCPYSASIGFNVAANLGLSQDRLFLPVVHENDHRRALSDRFHADLNRVYPGRFGKKTVADAVKRAEEEQQKLLDEIYRQGTEFLANLNEDEYAFVGIGRGYTLLDGRASADTSMLFAEKGLNFIPSYFLNTRDIPVEKIFPNMYWQLGKRILQDSIFVAESKNLYPVIMTNYACGPDSILQFHLERIFHKADKPCLFLQTDGHTSNAQYGTRIMAHNQVVREHNEL
ncbi:MAG: BadF/BadG/BcrA/BcrD ATPase family protein [Lentisphaeria bacterium]